MRRVRAHGNEEIADVLLHQEVLAGVGNVFKSEICFVTGINPFCKVAALSAEQVQAVDRRGAKAGAANVLEDSGDTIVTYGGRKRRTTHESDPGASLWVYGRARRALPPLRRADPPPHSGAGRARHLLVPALPAHARWLGCGWMR